MKADAKDRNSPKTIQSTTIGNGLRIVETRARIPHELIAENALQLLGVSLILAGYLNGFLPEKIDYWRVLSTVFGHQAVTAMMIGIGSVLYFFALRGHRRVVDIDFAKHQFRYGWHNRRHRCVFWRYVTFEAVECLIVDRCNQKIGQGKLVLRLKQGRAIVLICGDLMEVEQTHRELCADIRNAIDAKPRRVRQDRRRIAAALRQRRLARGTVFDHYL